MVGLTTTCSCLTEGFTGFLAVAAGIADAPGAAIDITGVVDGMGVTGAFVLSFSSGFVDTSLAAVSTVGSGLGADSLAPHDPQNSCPAMF